MFEKVKTTTHGELLFNGGNIFLNIETKKVFITRPDTEGNEEEIDVIETVDDDGEAITSAVYKIVDEFYFNDFLKIADAIKDEIRKHILDISGY
jgi:glutamine amidotransferase-like uncharacterized protein